MSINVKVIDKAYYIINAFLNGQKIKDIQNLKIAVSSTYYISSKQIKEFCKIDKLCSLNLDIGIIEKIVVINPKIKIKIRETDSIPTYFQKTYIIWIMFVEINFIIYIQMWVDKMKVKLL